MCFYFFKPIFRYFSRLVLFTNIIAIRLKWHYFIIYKTSHLSNIDENILYIKTKFKNIALKSVIIWLYSDYLK